MAEILTNVAKRAEPLGVQVVDVRLRRIEFAPEISESVYRRMEAERTRVPTSCVRSARPKARRSAPRPTASARSSWPRPMRAPRASWARATPRRQHLRPGVRPQYRVLHLLQEPGSLSRRVRQNR
nr:SPFH domain-containing protein [Bordetella parapertussis]